MSDSDTGEQIKTRDRKLGDEWADWRGDAACAENEINEKRSTFFTLAFGVLLISLLLFPLIWYLIKPRIDQLNPSVSFVIEKSSAGLVLILLAMVLVEVFSLLKFNKSLFPYRLGEKVLLSLLPKTLWLGAKFGISRDRVGNSFIKVHNLIIKGHADKLNPERLLVLLPRCLRKEARSRIIDKVNGNAVKVLTVAGGEEARAAIKQCRPTLILALACERDLMSGIKDVAEMVPVLAIPNKRPEGPCKNTDVSLSELEEALSFIAERRQRNISIENSIRGGC